MSKLWRCLEEVRTGVAVPAGWRALLGEDYDAAAAAFLRRTTMQAGSYPCPRHCGCVHRVVRLPGGDIMAVCDCDSWNCDDIPLRPEDALLWEFDWARFSAGLRRAFELDRVEQDFGLLRSRRRPGEIFTAFADGPTAPVEDTARQAFAMVKALDAKEPKREASLLRVFRLYCVEGLSAEVTAQRCGVLLRQACVRARPGTA